MRWLNNRFFLFHIYINHTSQFNFLVNGKHLLKSESLFMPTYYYNLLLVLPSLLMPSYLWFLCVHVIYYGKVPGILNRTSLCSFFQRVPLLQLRHWSMLSPDVRPLSPSSVSRDSFARSFHFQNNSLTRITRKWPKFRATPLLKRKGSDRNGFSCVQMNE